MLEVLGGFQRLFWQPDSSCVTQTLGGIASTWWQGAVLPVEAPSIAKAEVPPQPFHVSFDRDITEL